MTEYMNFIDFIKEFDIPYCDNSTYLYENDNGDIQKNGRSLKSDKPRNTIKDKQTKSKWINVYLEHEDGNMFCLDIDDMNYNNDEIFAIVKEKLGFLPSYTLSCVKKKPHFYLNITDAPKDFTSKMDCLDFMKGDLIKKKHIVVENRDAELYVGDVDKDGSMIDIEWSTISKYLIEPKTTTKPPKLTKKKINLNPIEQATPGAQEAPPRENFELIIKLLDVLEPIHFSSYSSWIELLMTLKNLDIPYSHLDNFSKKCENYDEVKNKEIWNNYIVSTSKHMFRLSKLKELAKISNPEKTDEILLEYSNNYNFDIPLFSGAVSDYFKQIIHSFVYSNEMLYHFNGVYWKKDDKNYSTLHNYIDKEFFSILLKQSFAYQEKNIIDPDICKDMSLIHKQLSALRSHSSRKIYVEDIICKITNNDLEFDTNPYLFAFTNKIYDFKKMSFVKPNPLDYISMTTNYDYDVDYDKKKVETLNTLISTIHQNKNIRDYHLTALASGMIGLQIQKFFVCTGSGGNGKGLLHSLMLGTLGNYGYTLANTVLTNPMKQGSNPELANCHNKRFVLASEPDAKNTIKASVIKEITGNPTINARLNHSNDCECKITSTWFLECNTKAPFDEVCDAILRRLETILFNARFVDADKYDPEDKTITGIRNSTYETLEWKDSYKQALFMILLEKVPSFLEKGLVSPPEVLVENKKYLQDSDRVFSTISDLVIKTDDKTDTVKIKDLYNSFKNTQYFINLTKGQKRDSSYKAFVDNLSKNMFLRKYVTEDHTHTNILICHKYIVEEEDCIIGKEVCF